MTMKLAALAAALPLAAPAAAWAQGDGYAYYGHYGMGGGGWLFGPIMMVIFFALLVGAVVLILRLMGVDMGGGGAKKEDEPLEILRLRFARGELDREEYDERRKALGG